MEKRLFILITFMMAVLPAAFALECWNPAITSEAACTANTTCTWRSDQWGGWCEQKGCWNYNSDQSSCETDGPAELGVACTWMLPNENSGWCTNRGCWNYDGTDIATCEENDVSLTCVWNQPEGMGGWCQAVGCWERNTSGSCVGTTGYSGTPCLWDTTFNYCYEQGCFEYNGDETACLAGGCEWQEPNCMNAPVDWGALNNQTACEDAGKFWQTSSQGWCEQAQCWRYDNISLNGLANATACINNSAGLDCLYSEQGGWCWEDRNINCSGLVTDRQCFDSGFCFWDFGAQECKNPGEIDGGPTNFFEAKNPGCFIFSYNATLCGNTTGCTWNAGEELCEGLDETGVNCTSVTDRSTCTAIPMLSTCCEWSNGACTSTFLTNCWDQMQTPPEGASYCEDYNSYSSQALCEQIAGNPWFMPCKWDNATEHCAFRLNDFFGGESDGKLIEIDNQQMCESAGGTWIAESYCDGNYSISAGHCEPKFDDERNCNKACFACELQPDGTNWDGAASAQTACDDSERGCEFEAQASAPNGFGWCKSDKAMANKFFGDCKSDCGGCTNKPNAQEACDSSPAGCKWAPDLDVCVESGEKTCDNACDRCSDADSCANYGRGSPGACTWSDAKWLCEPAGGSTEVCWNGMDDDDDDLVDCGDSQCFSDAACGGDTLGGDCFLYTTNDTCNNATSCAWMTDAWGGWCDFAGATCWQHDSSESECLLYNESCSWYPAFGGANCEFNWEMGEQCWMISINQSTCETNENCTWIPNEWGGMCEHTLMSGGQNCFGHDGDEAGCNLEPGCFWFQDEYGGGGWCDPTFTSQCANLTTPETCALNSNCTTVAGYCDPNGFGGHSGGEGGGGGMMCFLYNGNEAQCTNQTGCAYFPNPMGGFCDIDRTCNAPEYMMNQTRCEDAGCVFLPEGDGRDWTECYPQEEVCFRNMTLQNNETECDANAYCSWRQFGQEDPGHCEPDLFMNNNQSGCEDDGGVWMTGWCNMAGSVQDFQGMEGGEISLLNMDAFGDSLCAEYTEISGFGLKDMGKSFGIGAKVGDLSQSAICNGQYISGGQQGQGTGTTKYYLYLDTDGSTTGGCTLQHDDTEGGYEFFFSYEASASDSTITESYTSRRCNAGGWIPVDIGLSTFRGMVCMELGGPMLSVDKSDLMKYPDLYDSTVDMRVYVTTADGARNVTDVCDEAGPGWYTPGSVDFDIGDMFSYGADNAQFEDILRNGFIEYEECYNNADDDKDEAIDCDDYDCTYAEVCENIGVNLPGYVDKTMPKVVGTKIEQYPDGALIMYDTSKPANGTVLYYGNDSTCTGSDIAIHDVGIQKSDIVREFKSWHYSYLDAETLGSPLAPSTQYYFKLKVCDREGKCALSKCSELKTSPASACKYCNFVTRIKVPPAWSIMYDTDQDDNIDHVQGDVCGENAGMKTNYTDGKHVNVFLSDTSDLGSDNLSAIIFFNATLTKSALNQKVRDVEAADAFKSGTQGGVPYAGLPRETRDKIINSLHPEICFVLFPIPADGCTELWHCDDDITTCELREDATLIEESATYCLWQIPYCEFSVWAGGDPNADGGGDNPPSGGGGGGGGAITTTTNGSIRTWTTVGVGESLTIPYTGAVKLVKLAFTKASSMVKLGVEEKTTKPAAAVIAAPIEAIYRYVTVTNQNIEGRAKIEMTFRVPLAWLEMNRVPAAGLKVLHYESHEWKEYPATWKTDAEFATTTVAIPSLWYFAIGGESTATPAATDAISGQAIGDEAVTGRVVDVPTADEGRTVATDAQPEQEEAKQSYLLWGVLLGGAILAGIVIVMAAKKKQT